ncbi:MAG: hypothetical protein IJD22_07850 [Clostridia bacterium]|nr:hypothetical protein [Clostridia bacterium]
MFEITKVLVDTGEGTVSSPSFSYKVCNTADFFTFPIASGFVYQTEVVFVNEEISAMVSAYGEVEFYDSEKNLLAKASITPDGEGRGRYTDVACKVDGDRIMIRFPEYEWIDNYPHCDGESDRWDTRVVGYTAPIVFTISGQEAVVAEG